MTDSGRDRPRRATARLGKSAHDLLPVACPGITAVQEALARLNYLPYTPARLRRRLERRPADPRAGGAHGPSTCRTGVLRANVRAAPPLTSGTVDPTTTGAMEVFEGDHGLPLGTVPTQQLWTALLADETLAQAQPAPLHLGHRDRDDPRDARGSRGQQIALSSPTNTGVPGADTQQGIFPIYVRYVATTMIGTNVDGSHYDDPGRAVGQLLQRRRRRPRLPPPDLRGTRSPTAASSCRSPPRRRSTGCSGSAIS